MNRCRIRIFLALMVAFASPPRLLATLPARDAAVTDKEKAHKADTVSVAVFDFDAEAPGNPTMGKQVAEIIRIKLSGTAGVNVVNRTDMDKIIREHELNQAGVADRANALQNGKLVGAKLIITGKISMSGGKLYIMSCITGTETTLIQGEWVSGGKDADVFELAFKHADQLSDSILKNGPRLIARADPIEDPLVGLKLALAARKLPKLAVVIQEQPVTPDLAAQTGRTAETQVRKLIKEAGFTLVEGDDKALADAGVTLVISGESFSEFAARIGPNMIVCTGHAEIRIKDRKTGEVLFSDLVTTRGVDLAENTAAKTALANAGHALGLEILRHFEKTIPAEKAGK